MARPGKDSTAAVTRAAADRTNTRAAHLKPPRQERSRLSFERALDAAVALLVERGSDAFTLAEVGQRAEVSIGSIYGRVNSKDDLLRSVQSRELERIDTESAQAFDGLGARAENLDQAVDLAIRAAAGLLRDNAALLGAFMMRANVDAVIAAAGTQTHRALVDRFTDVVMSQADGIVNTDQVAAVEWTFTVVYSVIARYLGLGSSRESAGEGDWGRMLDNLTDMSVAFLTNHRTVRSAGR